VRYGDISIFQDGGRPPSWICNARVWTTREEYLVVFNSVQNLVGIGIAVLTICEFQYYAALAGKCLFTSLLGEFSGGKNRINRGSGKPFCSFISLGMQ